MDKVLRDNIVVYVDKIGVEMATKMAERIINVDGDCISDHHIGLIKFHLSVMEYLYCDENKVDECCLNESKI